MGGYFDMHCHIIPEVDDGSDLLEESLAILDTEVRAGVTDIILTPHFRQGMFETDRDFVEDQYVLLKNAAAYRPEIQDDRNKLYSARIQPGTPGILYTGTDILPDLQRLPSDYCSLRTISSDLDQYKAGRRTC